MIKKKKFFFVCLVLVVFLAFGQNVKAKEAQPDAVFEATVIKILEEKEIERTGGGKALQQNILLKGSSGDYKDKEVIHIGISDADILSTSVFKVGEKVVVQSAAMLDGVVEYYIVDHVRNRQIYVLALIFVAVIMVVGGRKGFKALLSLAASFFVILGILLPLILKGLDPVAVSVIGALAIVAIVVYMTEGWGRKSHLAVVSAFIALSATVVVSVIFSGLSRLTGLMQEEASFLISLGENAIDFKGLLLAGIIIGTVGVLDDVIISQIETVAQIKKAAPALSPIKAYRMAYMVGVSHLGSMVNTLFLTYAGASLPLLILFVIKVEPFTSLSMTLNHEVIAAEVVRSLAGGIGVALSLPISTYLAAFFIKDRPAVIS